MAWQMEDLILFIWKQTLAKIHKYLYFVLDKTTYF